MEQQMTKMMEQLPSLLEKLSDQLGVASAKIWEWALLNVYVEVVTDFIVIGLTLILIFGIIIFNKWLNKNNLKCFTDYSDPTGYGVINIILGILCVIGIIISIISIFQLPSLIINPEWNAFQNIMYEVSQLR